MPKVTNTADELYGGYDEGETLLIGAGESAEVSQGKLEQLLEDFPGRFAAADDGGDAPKGRGRRRAKPHAEEAGGDQGGAGAPAEDGGDADETKDARS